MKKRKYTRPDVKISEWDFNESVCVMVNRENGVGQILIGLVRGNLHNF